MPGKGRVLAIGAGLSYTLMPLLIAGCDADPAPTQAQATTTITSGRIDPAPSDGPSRIVRESDEMGGEMGGGRLVCVFTIAYSGAVEQEVAWPGERCADVQASLISVDQLASAGQLDDLSPEQLADMRRMPGARVFYIESSFTASAYPLNSAGIIYEISLAD